MGLKGIYTKDRDFVEQYIRAYEKVTGHKLKVSLDNRHFYYTSESGTWLRELWRSGLWRIVAYVYPIEFLKGLYDSDGWIRPKIERKGNNIVLKSVIVGIGVADVEIADFILKLLAETLGIQASKRFVARVWSITFQGWDALERFAELVGYRESKRRRKLEFLLRIRHLSPRLRYEEWVRHYEKINRRWVERAQKPAPKPLSSS